jgi:hypothetical protein
MTNRVPCHMLVAFTLSSGDACPVLKLLLPGMHICMQTHRILLRESYGITVCLQISRAIRPLYPVITEYFESIVGLLFACRPHRDSYYNMQWVLVSTASYAITQIWPHVQHQLQACSIPLQAQRQMSPSQL